MGQGVHSRRKPPLSDPCCTTWAGRTIATTTPFGGTRSTCTTTTPRAGCSVSRRSCLRFGFLWLVCHVALSNPLLMKPFKTSTVQSGMEEANVFRYCNNVSTHYPIRLFSWGSALWCSQQNFPFASWCKRWRSSILTRCSLDSTSFGTWHWCQSCGPACSSGDRT